MIRTVHGRGYQFVGPVHESTDETTSRPTTRSPIAVPPDATAGPLISRDRELQTVTEQLDTGQLVTLVGPGGVGKTRLAVEVCRVWEDFRRP